MKFLTYTTVFYIINWQGPQKTLSHHLIVARDPGDLSRVFFPRNDEHDICNYEKHLFVKCDCSSWVSRSYVTFFLVL